MAPNKRPSWKKSAVKTSFSVALVLSLGVSPASAQSDPARDSSCGDVPEQFQQLSELLTQIQQFGVALAVLIASVMLVYAGILYMRGTPDSQQKARTIIMNTMIGLVIVLIAGGLVEFVNSILCGGA